MSLRLPTQTARIANVLLALTFSVGLGPVGVAQDSRDRSLTLRWQDDLLTVSGDFPGKQLQILYLEAYCRPNSTDRDWGETVIGHQTRIVAATPDGKALHLRDRLRDGVVVDHRIKADADEVDFRLVAHNPTDVPSQAHWAQPCVRVGPFTGCGTDDARALVPEYARKTFIFLEGRLARLPTLPWADQARYTPGQVYRPAGIPRDDVNPRPLSRLTPSMNLFGCYSADESQMMAIAWSPCQELFLGVLTCIHSDFRIGGLLPGERKTIIGKLYLIEANPDQLVERYRRDFGDH